MPTLNQNQRDFLQHLRDNHKSLGWQSTIDRILNGNQYSKDIQSRINVLRILNDYKALLKGVAVRTYGNPTKYLKI